MSYTICEVKSHLHLLCITLLKMKYVHNILLHIILLWDIRFTFGGYNRNIFIVNDENFLTENYDGEYKYGNCGTNNSAVILKDLTVHPKKLIIPQDITVSISFELLKDIQGPIMVSLIIQKKLPIVGYIKLPCVANYGSCTFYNACKILNTYPRESFEYSMACPKWLESTGIKCKCPFAKGDYTSKNINTSINTNIVPKWIARGDYKVALTMKNDKESFGCFKFQFRLS